MEIKYEDRDGKIYENDKLVTLNVDESKGQYDVDSDSYFDNVGIRKGILLCDIVHYYDNGLMKSR